MWGGRGAREEEVGGGDEVGKKGNKRRGGRRRGTPGTEKVEGPVEGGRSGQGKVRR